jgi:hypothetical protein
MSAAVANGVSSKFQQFLNHPAGPKTSGCPACARPASCHGPAQASAPLTPAPPPRPAVHFWAPAFKWGITFANIADLQRPAEKVSVPQQTGEGPGCSSWQGASHTQLAQRRRAELLLLSTRRPPLLHADCPPLHARAPAAITATGIIWSRYSTQITPVNYNLLAVNVFMAITGSYQLYRKFK